ncbi:MAG TPA: alanine racemase C-terminal domain-containing protein, partial [Acidobacteriota bacterium]|nr:alanine racemase C-terminal domain-containing protein [Acidobacteriota bacterium]
PVVGAVSMDLTAIDVTELPEVRSDEEVTVLEADGTSQISAYRLADAAETIPYEVLTAIGPRVERTYLG